MATIPSRELSGEEISNRLEWQGMQQLKREHGAPGYKGLGYFGEIPSVDKEGNPSRSTELAGEMEGIHFPLLVPTLTKKEIDHLVSGKQPTDEIWDKAYKHALIRGKSGKDPFATKYDKRQKIPTNEGATMATTLDAINNPLSTLGLTSLMGGPSKEKPPAPSQAAFPSIERPVDPRPGIERERTRIASETANLDAQIISNLADQGRFQAEQAKSKALSEAKSLREVDDARAKLEKTLYDSPTYKSIQEKSKEIAEKSTFNPDQQNAQTLAAVFSVIGAAGFLLGGNNKSTAKAALAAMNGMADGYSKGKDQYAREQRQIFETNQKSLRSTLDSLEKAFEYEISQSKNDIESATRKAKIAAIERDAAFINTNIDKYGLVATLEQLKSNKKRLETVLGALQKKEDAYSAEMQKEWFANESRKATAAAAQERVQYQEEERTRRDRERREDQQRRDRERREDTQNFQREMAQFRIENRPEKLVPGEKLSATKEKKIDGLISITSGLEKLKADFKPEYAGLGVFGFGADLELEAARRGLGKKEANDAARWWGRYNQYQAPNRHALFGATLTGNELRNYQSFTAKPSDSAETVRGFIDDQLNYSKDIFDVTAPAGYKSKAKPQDYESTFSASSPAAQPSTTKSGATVSNW